MTIVPDPHASADGIPPTDDGAADGLIGRVLPAIDVETTQGRRVITELVGERAVVYVYPATGVPGRDPAPGWDEIPGAVGCTVQSLGFRDHADEFKRIDWTVVGVSSQPPEEQREFSARVGLGHLLASDENLGLRDRLGLPTFEIAGRVFYRRLTMLVKNGVVMWVDYPVYPPNKSASCALVAIAASQVT